jgi:hypothetical protein
MNRNATHSEGVTMSATTETTRRELAYRSNDGVDVTLFWHEPTDLLSVLVFDGKTAGAFELVVDAREALDAFYHPYAYAAFRGLEFGAGANDRELAFV